MSKKGPQALPRHSAKSGKVSISVEPSRKAPSACVVVAVPLRVSHWVLDASKCHDEPLEGAHFDASAVARAAFDLAYEKIMGNTAAIAAHGATEMCCGAQGDHFLISVTCDKTFSKARKCAGTVLANLKWGSLFSRYSAVCKSMGVKADRAAFEAAAKEANAATKKGVQVIVTGRVNTKAEPVRKAAEMLDKKVKDAPPKGNGSARTVTVERSLADHYAFVNAPGLEGIVVKNFVASKGGPSDLHLASGRLFYPADRARAVGGLKSDAKIDPFAKGLAKLGSEGVALLVFQGACCCQVGPTALKVGSSMTEGQVKAAIKKAL